jgi:hypothetical protein
MRLVLAAESKARREEEQLELAEKNAEMCGASPFGSSCTHTFPSLVPLSSLQRTAFCVDSHGSPMPFHPLTWLPPMYRREMIKHTPAAFLTHEGSATGIYAQINSREQALRPASDKPPIWYGPTQSGR